MRKQTVADYLLTNATSTSTGSAYRLYTGKCTFQGVGSTTSGAGAAVIKVEVSNDQVNWIEMASISLTLSTTAATDGIATEACWKWVRGKVSSISGTGASVSLLIGGAL